MNGKRSVIYWADVFNLIGYIVIILLAPIGCYVLSMSFEMVQNTMRLNAFADNLFDYPLPPQTEEIERYAEVGLLTGNSNHCDYLAKRTLATRLSADEIEAFYRDIRLPEVVDHPKSPGVGVEVVIDPERQSDGRLRVIVSLSNFFYPPGLDIRCH